MFSAFVDRHILSIDWDARNIRIVEAKVGKTRYQILDVKSAAVPAEVDLADSEVLGKLVRQIIDREGLQGKSAVVNLPRDQVALNTLELPRTTTGETASMVQFQIGRLLPFPVADAAVDFAVPPVEGDGESYPVLVGAARKEVRAFYEDVCHHAGLKLDHVGLRPASNALAINELLKDARPERVLFVDIGPAVTEIDVIVQGRLAFSRAASVRIPRNVEGPAPVKFPRPADAEIEISVPGVGEAIEEEERPFSSVTVVNSLLVEVTRSIEAYRNTDPGATMSHVVVGGCTGLEEALAEAIQKRFGVNAETFNPAVCFGWEETNGEGAGALGAVLGLVLSQVTDESRHFDFLHPKQPESPSKARIRSTQIYSGVAAMFVIAAIGFWWKVIKPNQDALAELEAQAEAIKARLAEDRDLMTAVKSINEFESSRVVWVDELVRMLAVLPDNKEVVFDRLEASRKDARMDLYVRAKERELPDKLRQILEEARPDGTEKQYFDVDLSRQGEGSGDYMHNVRVSVDLLQRKPAPPKDRKEG